MAEILKGQVKWFNDAKGFGFIEHTNGEDVFVHYSVIEWDGFKTLKDGEEVEYELKAGQKGLHAAKVTRPQALKKRLEKKALEAAQAGQIAPNLQSGQVNTLYKSASDMVEVEQTSAEEFNHLNATNSDLEPSTIANESEGE